ncbi:MAG: PspC domain-containing protein [Bacteroidaceae bacterium]|nr:PspC domain-containing protein [Bacteroidaceae bacterium]
MKKTINIHLCNRIFTIDEDACQLLESYITNMRTYFSKREYGAEIADDIELRVSELLEEFKTAGTTSITLVQVQELIARIGNPEEMVGDEVASQDEALEETQEAPKEESESVSATTSQRILRRDVQGKWLAGVISGLARYFGFSDATPWRILFLVILVFALPVATLCYLVGWLIIPSDTDNNTSGSASAPSERQLFRNGRDKMLGGVISGLCAYFGGRDVTPWRLLFMLLCFMSFSLLLLLYFAMWLIVPEAVTAEERLRMRGEQVNFENVNREVMNEMHISEGHGNSNSNTHSLGRILLHILLLIIAIPIIILLILGVIAAISFLFILTASVVNVSNLGFIPHLPDLTIWITHQPDGFSWLLYTWTICGFIVVGIPLFALIRTLFTSVKPLSKGCKVTLIILWVLAFSIGIAAVITTCFSCVPV